MHLPQQRRLSGDIHQEIKNMLTVKANKTMIQQHIYRNTGKIITLKDLHNLASDKNSTSNDIGISQYCSSKELHQHLINCFENGSMNPFPKVTLRERKPAIKTTLKVHVLLLQATICFGSFESKQCAR